MSIQGSDPELTAEIINRLVQTASKNAIVELASNIEAKVFSRKNLFVEQIQFLKHRNVKQIHDELDSLRKATRCRQGSLNNRIDALREDKIALLSEQAEIASNLGILEPYTAGAGAGAGNIYTEINIEDNDRLFVRGEKSLLAEIEVLRKRTTDDPYIPALRSAQQQLYLLEKDRKVEELKIQDNSVSFLNTIRDRESELTHLEMISLDPQSVSVVQVNQTAFPPESPIKPNRKLIVALGAVLGLMIGVFGAFFLNFLEKQRQEED